ncbi:MAG: Alkaline phosphatase synthesis sensor protein PhoR [Acidobacteriota bacterium]|jgi:two-component system phosphate regulon sensor histidine kinase PhoR
MPLTSTTLLLLGVAAGVVLAFAALALFRASRAAGVNQRVNAIQAVARRYALGDLSRPAPDYGDDGLGSVARSMDQAVQELGRRVESLARDRARMEAILGSMIEGVLVVDEQGRLQLVNEAARRILKLEQGALNHSYVEAIRHPGIVEHLGRALAGGETGALELSVTRDTTRTLVAQVAPVVTAGRGAVLVMHDITELRKADLIRRDFVANVSHELRTPLTAIKGYAEALLDDPDDPEARERFIEIIHRQAERMERLVKDLLRLARLEAGQETVEVAPCDIAALVRGIVTDFEPMAAAKHQTIRVSVPEEAAMLETDAAKLHDIIRNLVENAVNYTPDSGAIEIGARVADGRFQLTVADTGHGIAPDDLGRVFERFYRVDKSRARPGGTGLGLSIVKHLVQVLEGEVFVENQPTGGALFTVNLPFR